MNKLLEKIIAAVADGQISNLELKSKNSKLTVKGRKLLYTLEQVTVEVELPERK
jgi:hypothetical protein